MPSSVARFLFATAAVLLSIDLQAAGGHHAVDDASILEPRQCKLEAWAAHARAGGNFWHSGAGCRLGPVEATAAVEYARNGGASATGYGLQLKWAAQIVEGWSVGVLAAPAWQAHESPRYAGFGFLALLTWRVGDSVSVHANAGRDFVHRGQDEKRWGVAAEWPPIANWSLVSERYAIQKLHFGRVGVRHSLNEAMTVDLSRAYSIRGGDPSTWTVGITWIFDQ